MSGKTDIIYSTKLGIYQSINQSINKSIYQAWQKAHVLYKLGNYQSFNISYTNQSINLSGIANSYFVLDLERINQSIIIIKSMSGQTTTMYYT